MNSPPSIEQSDSHASTVVDASRKRCEDSEIGGNTSRMSSPTPNRLATKRNTLSDDKTGQSRFTKGNLRIYAVVFHKGTDVALSNIEYLHGNHILVMVLQRLRPCLMSLSWEAALPD